MRLFELLVRRGRLLQHATEFSRLLRGIDSSPLELCGLLEGCQQELVAFGKVAGKRASVIHNATLFTDCCPSRKATSQ